MAWWFVRRVSTYAIPTQSCPRRRLHPPELPPARLPLRSTTARTGHPTAPPTPTNCSSPAAPTTNASPTATTTSLTDTGRLAWTDGTTPPDINHAHHREELLHGNTDPPHKDEK